MRILIIALLATLHAPYLQAEDRPNILFCIADDASWLHMGAYGCQWVKTPAFDSVARAGLLFARAYTPNAKCAPSRACILTGRNPWQLEAACNHWPYFPPQFRTYAEVLGELGYHVGMTGKGWAPGVAVDADGKPRQLAGQPFGAKKLKPPTKAISNNDYAGNFADFLDANAQQKPWCFWYGSTEPHRGYEYGTGVSVGGKSLTDIDEVPPFWPDNEVIRNDILDYALEIEHFDGHLQRMLDDLKLRGQLDNTIVVVTADNGMPFPRIKGQEYELSNHLPLAIMWPKGIQNPGRTVHQLVSFVDFAPTFLQAAGIDWDTSGMSPNAGVSLIEPVFSDADNSAPIREFLLIGKERHDIGRPQDQGYPIRGVVEGDYLYIRNFETDRWPAGNPETGYLNCDGSPTKSEILNARRYGVDTAGRWQMSFGKRPGEELYRLTDDRYCMRNLAGIGAYDLIRSAMADRMIAALRQEGDPRMDGQPDYFEKLPYADKNGSGFYERWKTGEKVRAGWVNTSDFETEQIDD